MKPMIRIANTPCSCSCCDNDNHESRIGMPAKKVDTILELVTGNMVRLTVCPDCLRSLMENATALLGNAEAKDKSEHVYDVSCLTFGEFLDFIKKIPEEYQHRNLLCCGDGFYVNVDAANKMITFDNENHSEYYSGYEGFTVDNDFADAISFAKGIVSQIPDECLNWGMTCCGDDAVYLYLQKNGSLLIDCDPYDAWGIDSAGVEVV